MAKRYDVIIAGAGPIGLFLACELSLGGASVLVLERDLNAQSSWKGQPLGLRGLNTPSIESFYRRGLLNKLIDPEKRPSSFQKTPGFQFGGHFAGIMFNANELDLDRCKYRLNGPALLPSATTLEQVETILIERAESLGVTILRGHGFEEIVAQDDKSITVKAGHDQSFCGRWLVGCDGGRSVVRKAGEFEFVGTEAEFTGYVAQCELDHPEKLKPGFIHTPAGMYIFRQPDILYLIDFDGGAFDRRRELTKEHLQEVLSRTIGISDLTIKKVQLASSFTDRSKLAKTYRKGRILLAGDAAHIHPPLGAQGLNLGLGDAMNLGWKLAATIRQEKESDGSQLDLTLLDTYESERQPAAKWVLEWARAQVSILQPNLYGSAMQTIIRDVINTKDGANLFIDRFWGLSQHYNLSNNDVATHPLIGCSAPDFELNDGSRLGSKLEAGKALLVDFEQDSTLKELIDGGEYSTRLDYLSVDAKDRRGLGALLIRPDGVVSWAAEENATFDLAAAKASLKQWLGY